MSVAPKRLALAAINALPPSQYLVALGGVFEHSPWVAERSLARRPHASRAALHAAMVDAVESAGRDAQLRLLDAHPELAGKEVAAGTLTAHSSAEQSGAGLVNLAPEEKRRIAELNAAYRAKFGHPFIIAVREHSKDSIFAEFERRLGCGADEELRNCLAQVYKITGLRLESLIVD